MTTNIDAEIEGYFNGNAVLIKYLFLATGKHSLLHLGDGDAALTIEAKRLEGRCFTLSCRIAVTGGKGLPPITEQELFRSAKEIGKREGFNLRVANLYYARLIARRFGGDVWLENSVGFGTCYRFAIRLLQLPV